MKGDIIPNGEFLYKYVKPETFPDDQSEIPHGIFVDESLSCDWAAIQKTPEHSFHITEGKNIIVRISVCDEIKYPCNPERPRQKQPAWEQKVEHDPLLKGDDVNHPLIENPSHSLINGKKKTHVTIAIARNSILYKKVDPNQLKLVEEDKGVTELYAEKIIPFNNALYIASLTILIIVLLLLICT
jgi:hypothetical protein